MADHKTNWFLNLNRKTAAEVSRGELEKYYVALLNAGYLTSLYLMSQIPPDFGSLPDAHLLPADVVNLIRSHPYTSGYQLKEGSYDYLAESIDSVQRLRSYTDLLERLAASMRKHVNRVQSEHSKEIQGHNGGVGSLSTQSS